MSDSPKVLAALIPYTNEQWQDDQLWSEAAQMAQRALVDMVVSQLDEAFDGGD